MVLQRAVLHVLVSADVQLHDGLENKWQNVAAIFGVAIDLLEIESSLCTRTIGKIQYHAQK